MKKFFLKIVLTALISVMAGGVLSGCFFAVGGTRVIKGPEIIVKTNQALFSACIDEDSGYFEEALDTKDVLVFKTFNDFTAFFEGHEYSEYNHLLGYYEEFSFSLHNIAILRTEPVTESRPLSLLAWSMAVNFSSSLKGEGMHYYLLIIEKDISTIIIDA